MAFRFTPPCCCSESCESLIASGAVLPCSGIMEFDDLIDFIEEQTGTDSQYGYTQIIGVTDSTDGVSTIVPPRGGYYPMVLNQSATQKRTFFANGITDVTRLNDLYSDRDYFENRREYQDYAGKKYGLVPRVYGIWKKCAPPVDGQDYNLVIYDGQVALTGTLGSSTYLIPNPNNGLTAWPSYINYKTSRRDTQLPIGSSDVIQQAEYYLNEYWDEVNYIMWNRFVAILAEYAASGVQGLMSQSHYNIDNVPGTLVTDVWSTEAPASVIAPSSSQQGSISFASPLGYVAGSSGASSNRTYWYTDPSVIPYQASSTVYDRIYKDNSSTVSDLAYPSLPSSSLQDVSDRLLSAILPDITVWRHYEALYC